MLRRAFRALSIAVLATLAVQGAAQAAAPVISNLRVSSRSTSTLTLSWTTDVPATSQVKFGFTREYGSRSAYDPSLVTEHAVTLSRLRTSTVYNLQAVSIDTTYFVQSGQTVAFVDSTLSDNVGTHTSNVVIRPSAGSNGVRSEDCTSVRGLQPLDPSNYKFAALLLADSTVFGPSLRVKLVDASGDTLPGTVNVTYIDSLIVGLSLPLGGAPVGVYDVVYSQSGRRDVIAAGFNVLQPFCFQASFEERQVSLLWGQNSATDTPGVMNSAYASRIEALPGFNGYKVWRGTSPDTSKLVLLRNISRTQRDRLNSRTFLPDSIGWSWKDTVLVGSTPQIGWERRFADPDSFFFRRVRQKTYTEFVNGVATESLWVEKRQPEIERYKAAPHAGVHYYYAITAQDTSGIDMTLKIDNMSDIVPQSAPRTTLANVVVVPNPYYGHDYHDADVKVSKAYWNRTADEHKIQFIHLPKHATVRVYTASGDLVREIVKNNDVIDALDWDVRNIRGDVVQAGIYLYHVLNSDSGEEAVGHFVVLP